MALDCLFYAITELMARNNIYPVNFKSGAIDGQYSSSQKSLDISFGEEVILLGGDSKEFVSVKELADRCETISYEIFCGISYRVPRVFVSEEKIQKKRIIGQYI